jgi:hypothetical protein
LAGSVIGSGHGEQFSTHVTTVTLDISRDNVRFGLCAVDAGGNRGPVAFPQVVTT